jgi:hypothetical protein
MRLFDFDIGNPRASVASLAGLLVNMFLGLEIYDLETLEMVENPKESMFLTINDTKYTFRPHRFVIDVCSTDLEVQAVKVALPNLTTDFARLLKQATDRRPLQTESMGYVSAEIDLNLSKLVTLETKSDRKREAFTPKPVQISIFSRNPNQCSGDNGFRFRRSEYIYAMYAVKVFPKAQGSPVIRQALLPGPVSMPVFPEVRVITHKLVFSDFKNARLLFTFAHRETNTIFPYGNLAQIYKFDATKINIKEFKRLSSYRESVIPTPENDRCLGCGKSLTQDYYILINTREKTLARVCQFHTPRLANNTVIVFRDYNPKLTKTEEIVQNGLKYRGPEFTKLYRHFESLTILPKIRQETKFPPVEYRNHLNETRDYNYNYIAEGQYLGVDAGVSNFSGFVGMLKPGTTLFSL